MTSDGAKLPRVAPPRVFPVATRAPKPPADAAGSADAYRQTTFVLGREIDLLLEGFALESAIAEASSDAKHRTQNMAAGLGLWSRSWLSRLQAMHAIEWGNYAAAVVLVRGAADYQAGGLYILRDDASEWRAWLEIGGISVNSAEHATEYRLHAFRAAEVLAGHETLGPIYRAAMDLSLSHFGATLLFAGSDSTPDRILMTFGDRDFHLALGELLTGWLLLLSAVQLEAALEFTAVFAIPDEAAVRDFASRARAVAQAPARCRIELAQNGDNLYLVHNWRRQPGAAPKRILL